MSEVVSVHEVECALTDLTPSPGQTWVKVKELAERVRIRDGKNTITGDVVWIVVRGDIATTVMIRRKTQSIRADRVVG